MSEKVSNARFNFSYEMELNIKKISFSSEQNYINNEKVFEHYLDTKNTST